MAPPAKFVSDIPVPEKRRNPGCVTALANHVNFALQKFAMRFLKIIVLLLLLLFFLMRLEGILC